jgi:phosphoserine phosphatase RsbU/P
MGAMGEAAELSIDGGSGRRRPGLPRPGRGWRPGELRLARPGSGIPLGVAGPAQPSRARAKRVFALLLWLAITAAAGAVHYRVAQVLIPVTWLAVGPLLASLLLAPLATAALAGWAVLLGVGLMLDQPGHPEGLVSRVSVLVLLAAFAVVNAAMRAAAQRRLRQVRAVARVAQSAVLREVPTTVAAGRLASRYLSAAAEAQVGGDLLEVVSDGGRSRWLIGDTRGKGLPAVRLASIAMTSFRDACARPGLALPEIARVVDQSVTRAVGDEGFVTAVFAEFDPRGWLQLVTCGHPPPLRVAADGGLRTLAPNAYATPLGLHPDIQSSTFTIGAGDRLLFYTDGLLEARDRAGRFFRLDDCADTLRKPDLEAAADELLTRLMAHTGRRLEDDIALLLFEATPAPVPVPS